MPVATPGLPRTAASIVDLIGNTPLIRLTGFEAGLRQVELYAKAEWRNPGGSVKDRAAARMIADGETSGALTRDIPDVDAQRTQMIGDELGCANFLRAELGVLMDVLTPGNDLRRDVFGESGDLGVERGERGEVWSLRAREAGEKEPCKSKRAAHAIEARGTDGR